MYPGPSMTGCLTRNSSSTSRPSPWRRRGDGAYNSPAEGDAEECDVSDAEDLNHAIELWQEAYRRQMAGDLDEAITLYRRSLAVRPTAEAHTFLGWTYSFQGRLEDATAECLKAIGVDPDFGNPYNDIGGYLMQQSKLHQRMPWLGKARRARRYEPRQFPFMNLGRIHIRRGRWWEALREFEGAVAAAPGDAEARKALHGLRAKLN